MGSLYAAVASFLQARSRQGKWLLRIDDLDTLRNVPGATENIIRTLELYGLHWDESILYQSLNTDNYHAALAALENSNLLFPCECSRKTLVRYRLDHPDAPPYPGNCRDKRLHRDKPHALRIKTAAIRIAFQDALQGNVKQELASQHGDFIVKRKDRIIAYQLAVVIDDQNQKITEVVRGFDLLDSTIKQIFLQKQLGLCTPAYMHVPIIVDPQGCKLSKQTFAKGVDHESAQQVLFSLLKLLKQNPPAELDNAPVDEQLCWAIEHWNPASLKKIRAISPGID